MVRRCVRNVTAGHVVLAVAEFGTTQIIIVINIIYVTTVPVHGAVLH
jgi:hypothetical protein